MCQEAVRRLCNPSESSHVRKVARLLARPLSTKIHNPTPPPNLRVGPRTNRTPYSHGIGQTQYTLRTISTVKTAHNRRERQEKSRAALGRGISEGVRLNNDQIIVPRWAGAHTPKE
jgi:hypothetical protein